MENSAVDRKALAASLIGCQRDELLGFRDEGLSGVVLIAPDGSKHHLPEELLRRAAAWLVEIPGDQDAGPASKPAEEDGGMANSVRPESRPTARAVDVDSGPGFIPAASEKNVGRVSKPAMDPVNDQSGGMANSVRPESRPTKKAPRSKKGKRP